MQNSISKLPSADPGFLSLSQEDRLQIAEAFLSEYEALVKKRNGPLERAERMDVTEDLDAYWKAWKENFRVRWSEGYFGASAYRSLSFRFYSLAGKRGYKDAHEFCLEMIRSKEAGSSAWYFFADLQYRFWGAGETDEERTVREMFEYYGKAVPDSQDALGKSAALSAARGYLRHLENEFPDSYEKSKSIAEEILGHGWMETLSATVPILPPVKSVADAQEDVQEEVQEEDASPKSATDHDEAPQEIEAEEEPETIALPPVTPVTKTVPERTHGKPDLDEVKRRFEESWKDLTIAVITTERGAKLVRDMKRDGTFAKHGLMNDRGIEAFDSWKEKNRSGYEFLRYDIILVGENDHTFRDIETNSKGNAVTTFFRENRTGRQVILELRRGSKPPKTDRSVIEDKLDEAKTEYLTLLMKEAEHGY